MQAFHKPDYLCGYHMSTKIAALKNNRLLSYVQGDFVSGSCLALSAQQATSSSAQQLLLPTDLDFV